MKLLEFIGKVILLLGATKIYLMIYFMHKLNEQQLRRDSARYNFELIEKIYTQDLNIEFQNIIEKHCQPNKIKIEYECIESIKRFDRKLSRKKENATISYNRCHECYEYLDNNNKLYKNYVYYHTFWQINSANYAADVKTRVLYLNLMSYLVTQNLCCTKFIFWKLKQFPKGLEDEIKSKFDAYFKNGTIEMKTFEIGDLCTVSFFKASDL